MPRLIASSAISTTGMPTIPKITVTPRSRRVRAMSCAPVFTAILVWCYIKTIHEMERNMETTWRWPHGSMVVGNGEVEKAKVKAEKVRDDKSRG